MFFKSFIMSAVVAFVAALIAGMVVLSGDEAQEVRTVEFTATAPITPSMPGPVGALDAARAHADEHGLTDCVDPAHARLDDVVLTFPNDPHDGAEITPVGFDEALRSGELGRWNVLACKAADPAA